MEYTVLPEWVLKERNDLCTPKNNIEEHWAKSDPTYFSYHYLGVRPFLYQHWLFREIRLEKRRVIVSSSRQIGKSTAVACLGLWAAMMNVHPTGLHSNTKIGIVSRSEDQSVKLLGEIKSIMSKGDVHLRKLTNGKSKRFITDQLDPAGRNNASQITFTNGCWIKCFPPTDAVRGECEVGDARVLLSDGTYKRIDEVQVGDSIVSSDHFKLVHKKVVNTKKNGVKPVIKFKTRRGKEITVTHNHPLMTRTGWKAAQDITILDELACPKELPFFGTDSIGRDKARLLGYILGDGHCRQFKSVGFTNADPVIIEDFLLVCKNLGISVGGGNPQKHNKAVTFNIYGGRNGIKKWLKEIGLIGLDSHTKYVLPVMQSLCKVDLKEFINAYFACDGWVFGSKDKTARRLRLQIGCYSASLKLARGMQSLLLKFGVLASLRMRRKGEFVGYELGVKDKLGCKRFLERIGVIMKESRLDLKILEGVTQSETNNLLDFDFEPIKAIVEVEPQMTYGLTVEDTHCYISNDILSHNTFDFVFVDEAAMVGEEIFRDCILPTVSHTDGFVIISSTPKGQQGYYYRLFDPEDKLVDHEFERYWFPYTVLQGDMGDVEAERQLVFVEKQREHAAIRGDSRGFDQEYRALFTADEEAFLANAKVDEAVSADIDFEFSWPEPCSLGVDYGMTNCKTVISVSTMDRGKVRLLWQHAIPSGDDSSPEVPIEDFVKRYKVFKIVVDDCAQGFHVNKSMEMRGWPIQRFNFRSDQADRNKHYFLFRSALNQGGLRIPVKARDLVREMKALREIQNKVFVSIRAVEGEHDDFVDSFMMSSVPFLDKEGEFASAAVDTSKPLQDNLWTDGRNDLQWKNLVETQKALNAGVTK